MSQFWNFTDISIGHQVIASKLFVGIFYLGNSSKVTPYAIFIKLGTVGLVGYLIALTAAGPQRLTGFVVSRHKIWVTSIDKAHRAYYTTDPVATHQLTLRCSLAAVAILSSQSR
jgi:hypothetical protein